MEEVDTLSVAVSKIDINKVEPLDTRRVVAFINDFLCRTVTFLNQFSSKCESRLDRIQRKLFMIECGLQILEAKLDSIPELQNFQVPSTPVSSISEHQLPSSQGTENTIPESSQSLPNDEAASSHPQQDIDVSISKSQDSSAKDDASSVASADSTSKPSKMSLRKDPRYETYFKMVAVGVPVPAVKQKMASEGVDPAILDS